MMTKLSFDGVAGINSTFLLVGHLARGCLYGGVRAWCVDVYGKLLDLSHLKTATIPHQ